MPQIDNPDSNSASLAGRIKSLEERLDQLSSAPLGKVKFLTGAGPSVSPVVTSTPTGSTVQIQVPALATSCGFSVFGVGGALNTTSVIDYLQVKIEVVYGSYDRWIAQSQSGVTAGSEANVTTPLVDTFSFAPGGGTLTLTASMNNGGSGSWTNTPYNVIFPEGLFVFQY